MTVSNFFDRRVHADIISQVSLRAESITFTSELCLLTCHFSIVLLAY